MSEKGMGRRDFLKAAALSGVTLGTAGMLAGCASKEQGDAAPSGAAAGEGVTWDKEANVVVVGSGTGAFAALAAKKLGAESVVLLEKGNMWGGTAATSGGGMAIPLTDVAKAAGVEDSMEEVLEYFKNASEGRANPAVLESFATNGNGFLNWLLETTGWQCNPSPLFGENYYEPLAGWKPMGRGSLGFAKGETPITAAEMWTDLQAAHSKRPEVEIMMESARPRSWSPIRQGAVVGVKATSGKDEVAIKAERRHPARRADSTMTTRCGRSTCPSRSSPRTRR